MASPQLLWECVKKNNSAMFRKSPQVRMVMSACDNNLGGINAFKFSGLVGGDSFGLVSSKQGIKESIVLIKRSKIAKQNRPQRRLFKAVLPKSTKKGLEALDRHLSSQFYRKDLVELAKTKYMKIKKSFKKKKVVVKSRRSKM
eukprot:TRINITY_DN4122_c0_g1_i5.p1 TRINITY_DN4122_c0_g1~~TRINITY_DN4122_c0_g1_i5.p1  ORF type:complete len:143 (+),score=28.81 TRINITY_DN4122_c0_g1_i5:67-495(+)